MIPKAIQLVVARGFTVHANEMVTNDADEKGEDIDDNSKDYTSYDIQN